LGVCEGECEDVNFRLTLRYFSTFSGLKNGGPNATTDTGKDDIMADFFCYLAAVLGQELVK
jgi:hypothetical protein